MYTINNFTANTDKCPYCQNSHLQFIGSQAYCSNCYKIVDSIQQELKIVPCLYNGNSNLKTSSIDKKMLQYINQFSNKFGGLLNKQQQTYLCQQAKLIHKIKGLTSKGFREDASVVVYHYFLNTHKLSLRQFCMKNQLKQKSFNKSYIAYGNYKRQEELKRNQSIGFKQQQNLLKMQEREFQSKQQEQQRNFFDKQQFLDYSCIKQQQEKIQCLLIKTFSSLFPKTYYEENKQFIIQKLTRTIVALYKKILLSSDSKAILFKQRVDFQTHSFYLLFCSLKVLKMRISIKDYIQKMKNCTGTGLKCKYLSNLKKLCQSLQQSQSNSDGYQPQNDLATGSCSEAIKLQNQSL